MLCVTRKRLAAGAASRPVSALRVADGELGVVVAGVEAGADRRRAEVQLLQLLRRVLDVVGAALDARGVAAELLAERHRHRVLQVRAADLEDAIERVAPCASSDAGERARRVDAAPRDRAAAPAASPSGYTSLVDCPMLT